MSTDTTERRTSRPNVLALPSATTAQLILLLTAIFSAGGYIGISLHDWLLASSYVNTLNSCFGKASKTSSTEIDYLKSCFWPTEIRRGLFALGIALALLLLLAAILLLAQALISRRRPGREMTQYYAESRAYLDRLRNASGVSSNTVILVGPPAQQDAFTYGAFGRYRIQLPRGLAVKWRTRELFEPVLMHEFAHIFHRDVKWGWFARASWYAITPALLASIIVPAVQHDWPYFWGYAWRAVLLAVLTQLLIRSFLRARETDADLRAAQILHGTSDITAAVSRGTSTSNRIQMLLAFHPSARERIDSIADPAVTVRISFANGFTAALLATLSGGIFLDIAQNLLFGLSNSSSVSETIAIGLSNSILGFAIGGGLLRNFTVGRVTGNSPSVTLPTLGVGLGIAVGSLASLAQTGLGTFDGGARPWEIATAVITGMAATVYAAAVARLWTFSMPFSARPRISWVAYCALATGIFWVIDWVSDRLGPLLNQYAGEGFWSTLRITYFDALLAIPSWTLLSLLAILGLLIAGLMLLRPPSSSPAWLLDNGESVTWEKLPRRLVLGGGLIVSVSLAGAIAMVATEESTPVSLGLIRALIGASLLTGVCAGIAVSILVQRTMGAPALPAAIVSSGLSLVLAAAAGPLLHQPFRFHELGSIARPAMTAAAVASVLLVPVIVRAVSLATKTR
jgi:Zn-dependent protease with chaperone function